MQAGAETNMEPSVNFNKRIGIIGIELLTKAALCAATIALIAGMAAAVFYRSE
jgi:hypothetical protein